MSGPEEDGRYSDRLSTVFHRFRPADLQSNQRLGARRFFNGFKTVKTVSAANAAKVVFADEVRTPA